MILKEEEKNAREGTMMMAEGRDKEKEEKGKE